MKTKILPPAESAYQYPLLIKSLLLSGERYQPDQEIVYADYLRYDYKTLNQRIRKLANVLTEAGIKAGDTVAVMDWDSHRYLEAYFAVPMLGAVLHHINVRLSPEQVAYTIQHAEDDLILIHDDFLPLASAISNKIPNVKQYIQLTEAKKAVSTPLNTIGEYEELLSSASDQYDFPDFDENSIATTFYTTGTTGDPKGVYFTHRQLVLHTLNMSITLGTNDGLPLLRSDDVYMPMTPMFHVHAWGVPYVATMLGVKQVYPGRYNPDKMVQLFANEKVSFSHCVPAVLQMILGCDQAKSTNFNGWKLLTGGSAATPGLAQSATEKGISIYTGYGMSETCPLLTATYLKPSEREKEAVKQLPERIKTGMPCSLVDLKIVDAKGNYVDHDGESMGEIVVRAPWLTQSYIKEPEKSEELWKNGWLHTGDVGSIDKNGILEIKDRIKDVIKTGGEWISSLELENLISHHQEVKEVAVVGVPDEQWDERPLALIVLNSDKISDIEQIKQHLQQYVSEGRINKWAIPKDIRFVQEIPKTSVGKINKKLIREALVQ